MSIRRITHECMPETIIELVTSPAAIELGQLPAVVSFRPFGHGLCSIYSADEAVEIGRALVEAGEEARLEERRMRLAAV